MLVKAWGGMDVRMQAARYLLLGAAFALATPSLAQVRVINSDPTIADPTAGPVIANPLDTGPVIVKPDLVPAPTLRLVSDGQPSGDDSFRPEVGQAGKDVIWVPTPDSLVKAMLTVADVKSSDYVVDLGAGDGKIAIAAGRDFGARAHGIEYNPDMVALARRNAQRAGVADRVTFAQGDIFQSDFSNATVVTLYLLPSLNEKLRPTLLKMKPGTRIVSNSFTMGDWEPEQSINTDDGSGYFWIVPADASGRWAFEIGNDRFVSDFHQRYQKITPAKAGPIRDATLRGRTISITRANGQVIEGQVNGDRMTGRGWIATRVTTGG